MSVITPYQHYLDNAILGADPEQLTLMLYNSVIKFIGQALHAVEKKDVAATHNAIVRAQDIVSHLAATLKEGYTVSAGLLELYHYLGRRLVEANIHKDTTALTEVLGIAEELRDTWFQAMQQARREKP